MKERRKDYIIIFEQQKNFLSKSCIDYDNGDESEAIRIAGHLRTILHDSYKKKKFDTKLIDTLEEIKEFIDNETFSNKKKVLNKLNGVRHKIEQQHKEQILSKSLLTQLGLKDKINFLDTSSPKNSVSNYTLIGVSNTIINPKSYFGLLEKEATSNGKDIVARYKPLCSQKYFNIDNCHQLPFEEWWHKEIYNDGKGNAFNRKDIVTSVANLDGYAHVEEEINVKYQNFKNANILDDFITPNKKNKINLATLASIRQIAYETLWTMQQIEERKLL